MGPVDAARDACARLGGPLGLSAEETAWGLREIALAGMAKAVRSRLGERGLDPRDHALLSYGGCGALFTGTGLWCALSLKEWNRRQNK